METEYLKKIRTVGQRVYYTGDMANMPSCGTVSQVFPNDKWNYNQVEITFDDERFEGDTKKTRIPAMSFSPGPGRRFLLLEEHEADQKAAMAQFFPKMEPNKTLNIV